MYSHEESTHGLIDEYFVQTAVRLAILANTNRLSERKGG